MSRPDLTIRSAALGAYQTNCYTAVSDGHLWVIDAGYEPGPLLSIIEESGHEPEAVLLTHAHADHIAGLGELRRRYPDVPIWMHPAEEDWMNDPLKNLSALSGMNVTAPMPTRLLEEGETLTLGKTSWAVLHTPGHSPGSLTFRCNEVPVAFVGDALFAGSIGRTDFPGCDHQALIEAIRTKLYVLDEEMKVLPGHGPATTIGQEKKHNPFVRGA